MHDSNEEEINALDFCEFDRSLSSRETRNAKGNFARERKNKTRSGFGNKRKERNELSERDTVKRTRRKFLPLRPALRRLLALFLI
jgi:hypothetical protein